MERKRTFYSFFLASTALILFLIPVSSTVSASSVEDASLTINETRITTSGSAGSPAIYADRIVWCDCRNGNRTDGPFDIYMYNISTHEETQITTSGLASNPAIYGDRIVWMDGRNGNRQNDTEEGYDVYMYDLSTKKETRITNSTIPVYGFGYSINLAISGDKIMWGGTYYYCIYDISTQKETDTDHLPIINPAFSGNIIVGVADIDGRPSNLSVYDFSTQKQTKITTSDAAFSPAIYNNTIVWAEQLDSLEYYTSDIYMYDLSTGKETQITTYESWRTFPSIYGDRIIWQDERDGNREIYMYNISTRTETHTTNTSAFIGSFYGDKIVWLDYRNDNDGDDYPEGDIYMATLNWDEVPPLDDNITDENNGTDNESQVPDNCSSELTPLDRTQALKEYVECTYKCHVKTKTGLATFLDTSMCHYKNCDSTKAVSMLKSFIHLAEKMKVCKQISADEADYMVREAKKIIDQIEKL